MRHLSRTIGEKGAISPIWAVPVGTTLRIRGLLPNPRDISPIVHKLVQVHTRMLLAGPEADRGAHAARAASHRFTCTRVHTAPPGPRRAHTVPAHAPSGPLPSLVAAGAWRPAAET